MKFEVEKETIEKVFAYLINQPFKEVSGIINELNQIKPITEDVPEPAKSLKVKK